MRKKNKGDKYQDADNNKKKGMMITEQHLMDKTHMDKTIFSPYLPQDSMYPSYPTFAKQCRKMLLDLNYLLYLDFKGFWATLLYNPTLKNYLSTSLEFFHRRWLNKYFKQSQKDPYQHLKYNQTLEYLECLFKITLMIIYRILHFNQQNPQLSRIYNLKQTITVKYILDIPKLLNLIQIYGQSNQQIIKIIVKLYVKNVTNFYNMAMNQHLPILTKKIYSSIFQLKKFTDRQQFGINYSYVRNRQNQLSPGQQQLIRKTKLIMQILSFYQTLKNIKIFFPQQCVDNIYFNHQIHFISQNIFYQLQAAYKVWNWQDQKQTLICMINSILLTIKNYFIQFFIRCDGIFLKKTLTSRTIDAYLKVFQRMAKDYGKRSSLGKKAANKRNLIIFGQIIKQYDLIDFLHRLYLSETQDSQLQINIDYLIDFKVTLENQFQPQQQFIGQQQSSNQNNYHQIQDDQQTVDAQQDQQKIQNKLEQFDQKIQKKQQQIINNKKIQNNQDNSNIEVIVSKKKRQQNYYDKLYKAYTGKITINYDDDQYDDLVDYQKKPLFIDQQSSNSDSNSDNQKQHRVSNINNMLLLRKGSSINRNNKNIDKPLYYKVNPNDIIKGKQQQDNKFLTQKKKYQAKYKQQTQDYNQKKKYQPYKNQRTAKKPKYQEKKRQEQQIKCDPMNDQPQCQKQGQKCQINNEQSKKPHYNQEKKPNNNHNNNNHKNYNYHKGVNKNKQKYKQK